MDEILRRLGDAPLPPALAHIDDAVLATLYDRRTDTKATFRLLTMAGLFALGVGYVGGSVVPTRAIAAETPLVLAENTLAPSTLLDFL